MLQGKVYGVYFSPTGGTRAYVTALAGLLSCEAEEIDLTAREERARDHVFGPEDLVILGAPVYAGRLPQLEGGIFERLRGDGTPAVFNVSYGNRAFEDALLEEQDICQAHGFHGIAAGPGSPLTPSPAASGPDGRMGRTWKRCGNLPRGSGRCWSGRTGGPAGSRCRGTGPTGRPGGWRCTPRGTRAAPDAWRVCPGARREPSLRNPPGALTRAAASPVWPV